MSDLLSSYTLPLWLNSTQGTREFAAAKQPAAWLRVKPLGRVGAFRVEEESLRTRRGR
jgi:hypothetical protein